MEKTISANKPTIQKPSLWHRIVHHFKARSTSENIVMLVYFVLFIAFAIFCLYPIFYCFTSSMKTTLELRGDPLAMPSHFTLSQFGEAIKSFVVKDTNFMGMLGNSLWQCFGSCALSVIASFLVAYPLARFNFPGKKLIYLIIIFRITIPIVGTAPAQYDMFRRLDMLNNPSLFWLAWLNGFDFTTLVLYGYLRGISKSYSEAAYLDGAPRISIMLRVILPQALPCMVAMFITQVLVKWNDYTTPQLYLRDYPNLAYGLYVFKDIVAAEGMSMSIYYSSVILAAIPPLILYGVGQRTMLKNVSIGGVKG